MSNLRLVGSSSLLVSPVGLGCWPMAGLTSVGVTDESSRATVQAALNCGINFFDTAYSYGYDGRSDRILRDVLSPVREQVVLASKVGMHWDENHQRCICGKPELLVKHTQEILQRLDVDYLDLLYLHVPDPAVQIEVSAQAIQSIVDRGWARWAGVSNVDLEQARRFNAVCPVVAIQPAFNMLQQQRVIELREFCRVNSIAIVCYWVLMKGLLAGQMARDHRFDPADRRLTYDIFQGELWSKNQDFVDGLRAIALRTRCTVAQLVVSWTIQQADITVALCGAKRPEQIIETSQAMHQVLDAGTLAQIDALIKNFV